MTQRTSAMPLGSWRRKQTARCPALHFSCHRCCIAIAKTCLRPKVSRFRPAWTSWRRSPARCTTPRVYGFVNRGLKNAQVPNSGYYLYAMGGTWLDPEPQAELDQPGGCQIAVVVRQVAPEIRSARRHGLQL